MSPAPIPLQSALVYGPVDSRRLGRSLGVNPLGAGRKLCNMSCIYCQYPEEEGEAGSFPDLAAVLDAVERALPGSGAEAVTVAGNGEPTLHPAFLDLARGLARLRDRYAPGAPLCLLTNGSRLDQAEVRAALDGFDRPIVKLDAGDPRTLHAINRPRGIDLERLLAGLVALPRLELQSMFVGGAVSNATPDRVARWIEAVRLVRPRFVQVTTVDRGTCVAGVRPVPAEYLETLAGLLRAEGIEAEAYPCRDEGAFGVTEV
ncbi:MAG: radical SAM protein [Planctomycetota bacterium]|nr:MAG: radical SAM protein [Planctomycetota bacterium]